MKFWTIFLALGFAWLGQVEGESHHHGHSHHHEHHNEYKFSIHQKDYRFSTVFEMDAHGKPHGSVVKSSLRWLKPIRDSYDVYDKDGEWCASGIGKIFSLGFFRPSQAKFDVYSKEGSWIGAIYGDLITTESAKYSIYNAKGDRVAIAYLDLTNAGIAVVHPEKTSQIFARLTRNFVRDQIDHWDVVVYDVEAIDPSIIKVLAAFAVDYQEYFKVDL